MTTMTGPDCAVMCNLINTHTYTHTHTKHIHTHTHTQNIHTHIHQYPRLTVCQLDFVDKLDDFIVALAAESLIPFSLPSTHRSAHNYFW